MTDVTKRRVKTSEGKSHNIKIGYAQNLAQLESAFQTNKKKRTEQIIVCTNQSSVFYFIIMIDYLSRAINLETYFSYTKLVHISLLKNKINKKLQYKREKDEGEDNYRENKETNNLEENENDNDEQNEAKSSTHNNSNTQTNNLLCYLIKFLFTLNTHKDWKMDGINLSNNLRGIGIIKRGHFDLSDTDYTSQISDKHWMKS
ncbi:hypothetical protein RIR_jg14018.t1 [Rhizophagus irregularis DAOM 181602=DAOM 197198]|nr:hypothetical protein RIR_jg14018.t1 [Rhizophagus irregularis DAOM 181602=DAOM 197198]